MVVGQVRRVKSGPIPPTPLCYISSVRIRHPYLMLLLVLAVSCGKSLEQQVQDQIRTAAGSSLDREAIEVTKIEGGTGNTALAEVSIHTAVRLERPNDSGEWTIKEVRVGDRKWEQWDRILEAINEDRKTETSTQLAALNEALERYSREQGSLPEVETFEELIDVISPRYLQTVIRIDAWWNPFRYERSGEQFRLRSAGPDGQFGTADDLVSKH